MAYTSPLRLSLKKIQISSELNCFIEFKIKYVWLYEKESNY